MESRIKKYVKHSYNGWKYIQLMKKSDNNIRNVKGIVLQILPSLNHPQRLQTCMNLCLLLIIFWRMLVSKQLLVPNWLPYFILFFPPYGSQWGTETAWLTTFLNMSPCTFHRRKKLTQVWQSLKVSKWWWWQNFCYPFKCLTSNQHYVTDPVNTA